MWPVAGTVDRDIVVEGDVGVADVETTAVGDVGHHHDVLPAGADEQEVDVRAMPWLTPRRCTFTSLTSPVMPVTVIDDGYGDAGPIWLADPEAGIAIAPVLGKSLGPARMPTSAAATTAGAQPSLAAVFRLAAMASAPPTL